MSATIQTGTTVWTFQDAVEAVLDSHDADRTGLQQRRARGAVLEAYRSLPQRQMWRYYYRQRLLQTVDDYGTGTVDFDYTGGTYELQLTLTGGTWPAWAGFGHVIIGNYHYDVEDRKSNSVLTLSSSSNPGADLATGTTYNLYRSAYPLPSDFDALSRLFDVAAGFPIHLVDETQQHLALQRLDRTPGQPRRCAIRATGKYLGLREIILGPPPSTTTTYDMFYRALPRPLVIDDYSAGTVTVSSGGTAVTGTSTAFPSSCAGSIIRFSSGAVRPSNALGDISGADNPFVWQDVIKSYTNGQSITLANAAPQAFTGVGYTISDPLDIEPNVMLTALLRAAEAEFSRKAGRTDTAMRDARAREELLRAMEADSAFENGTGTVLYNPFKRAPVTTDA